MLAEVYNIEDYAGSADDNLPNVIKIPVFTRVNTDIKSTTRATAATTSATPTTTTATTTSITTSTTIDNSITMPSIPLSELYPLTHELKPELGTALSLLEEGIKNIDVAIKMIIENELISSDDAIQRFQALLPELFCCRNLGDGFGAIVSSIFNALRNLEGMPANLEQLKVIKNITTRILTEPFIAFDEAVDEIILFEAVGLITEPSHFEYAADLLIE